MSAFTKHGMCHIIEHCVYALACSWTSKSVLDPVHSAFLRECSIPAKYTAQHAWSDRRQDNNGEQNILELCLTKRLPERSAKLTSQVIAQVA